MSRLSKLLKHIAERRAMRREEIDAAAKTEYMDWLHTQEQCPTCGKLREPQPAAEY